MLHYENVRTLDFKRVYVWDRNGGIYERKVTFVEPKKHFFAEDGHVTRNNYFSVYMSFCNKPRWDGAYE